MTDHYHNDPPTFGAHGKLQPQCGICHHPREHVVTCEARESTHLLMSPPRRMFLEICRPCLLRAMVASNEWIETEDARRARDRMT